MSVEKKIDPDMKGWLYKWTNYLKGYQKRWFVLSGGLLSYYRNQAEAHHTCRGNLSLHDAIIHTEDSCNFVISNGGTQTFHLKAATEVERQKWVTALELAKAKAVRILDSDDDEVEGSVDGSVGGVSTGSAQATAASIGAGGNPATHLFPNTRDDNSANIKAFQSRLEDLKTCNDLIVKHAAALHKSLAELEAVDATREDLLSKNKTVNERATLFRISSNAMVNACTSYVSSASSVGRRWQRQLQHEKEQRARLEEMVEQLARQHSHLEQEAKQHHSQHHHGSINSEDEEEQFLDAVEEIREEILLPATNSSHKRNISDTSQASGEGNPSSQGVPSDTVSGGSSAEESHPVPNTTVQVIRRKENPDSSVKSDMSSMNGESQATTPGAPSPNGSVLPAKIRRKRVPEKPSYPLNLWSIMKNCIGKELSKIPMPVNFSEPLSFLQRLTEDFEYSYILDKAAQIEDSCEQLAWVAAFTVSSYATTAVRTAKPFNPLLGETFECDRSEDMGFRAISEQVSHHPPIVAQHVEGTGAPWEYWQEFSMSSKFRGKYLQIIPLGTANLTFTNTGHHFTFRKVSTTVHNMIVGKLWLDNHGEMDIVNHKTGDKCCLKFIPYSYFSREVPKKVTGYVVDKDGKFKWFLTGTWDEKMEACRVVSESTVRNGKPVYETDSSRVLWKRNPVDPECEKYYNFTELACQLNEMEEGIAPTDSRHRPDQRHMEQGDWELANDEKVRLEEKQRAARRHRENEALLAAERGEEYPSYKPVWFRKEQDEATNGITYAYNGNYWDCKEKQDWSTCPDIF